MTADPGIGARFAAVAGQQPRQAALVTPAGTVSYDSLLREVCGLAGELRREGVRPGDRVMVALERGHGYVVVLMALLMLGAAAVPVDEAEPPARVERLRERVEPRFTVGRRPRQPGESGYFQVRDGGGGLSLAGAGDLPGDAGTGAEAVVFSTSGSTGTPKGVVVPAGAVLAGAGWCQEHLDFGPADVHVFKTAVSFVSVLRQVVWPLITGGQVVILPADRGRDLLYLGRLLRDQHVTVSSFFPSHLGMLMRRDLPASLRCLMIGGEQLTVEFVHALRPRTAAQLVNVYGMTECNIISSFDCAGIDRAGIDRAGIDRAGIDRAGIDRAGIDCAGIGGGAAAGPVPLGLAGTPGLSLRRPDLSVVADAEGAEGELCVESDQVAAGYAGLPAETAARFPADPVTGRAILRTGDYAGIQDGRLYFRERVDKRVKIRGYSVDPSAVERCLVGDVGVNAALVFRVDRGVSDQRLEAAVVTAEADSRDHEQLLSELCTYLPDYMIPSRLHVMGLLPTTPSGKVDPAAVRRELGIAPGPSL